MQLTALLNMEDPAVYVQSSGLAVEHRAGEMIVLAGTGQFQGANGKKVNEIVDDQLYKLLTDCAQKKASIFQKNCYVGFFRTRLGSENILYMQGKKILDKTDRSLIRLFSSHISVAFDNIYLNQEIEQAQMEILYTLSEIVETRSKETGYHVRRVAETARIIAQELGLPADQIDLITQAATLHDVGKIAVGDDILLKEGCLDKQEFNIIKTHTSMGYEILKDSKRKILKTAARIAMEHHEYWNGGGYPQGIKEDAIFLPARIVCVADVFDALVNRRVYKDPWEQAKALAYIKDNRGIMFDPAICDAFFSRKTEIVAIQGKFRDE